MKRTVANVLRHFATYVERYAVLGIGVLTPASGLLGSLAADLGGINTALGKALLAVSAALATGAAGLLWLKGRSAWTLLERFGPIAADALDPPTKVLPRRPPPPPAGPPPPAEAPPPKPPRK